MAEDHIRYDILSREALRGMVKKVLSEVAATGLPGNHHFFISFATRAPGVRIAPRLLERYPSEMTIVLQNQFWDLKVTDTGFEVGLSFDDKPETLIVPFAAMRGFFDPSVEFGVKFDFDETVDRAPEPEEESDLLVPEESPEEAPGDAGNKVVSLDSFRKKT